MLKTTVCLAATLFFVPIFACAPAVAADTPISEIQGAGHKTAFAPSTPVTVTGVVTAVDPKGFFIQSADANADADPATSEGIYVFLGNNEHALEVPPPGTEVRVEGRVFEFRMKSPFPDPRKVVACGTTEEGSVPNTDAEHFLTTTELIGITAVTAIGPGELPDAIPLVPPGAMTGIAFADVPNTPFDPADHPRDYFESLEGMRVVISDAVVVSRREGKVLYAVSRAALQPAELTAGGLPKSIPGHIFPEVVKVRLSSAQTESLVMEAGFGLGDLTGIVGYDAGEIIVQLDHVLTQSDITQVERPAAEGPEGDGFRFATFNAENLSTTTPNIKVKRIAEQITGPLGAPDLIALQEIQDDDGTGVTGIISSQATLGKLVQAIIDAGGPTYQAIWLDPPLPNVDGGAPGGNIRNAYLLRSDSGAVVGEIERLFNTGDLCDADANPFYLTRKPLLLNLEIGGKPYVFVNVHLSSKVGDVSLYSSDEDPQAGSAEGRRAQAEALAAELDARYPNNPPSIIVLGDFNDLPFADTLVPLEAGALGLGFVNDSRGEAFRYSSSHQGLRQAIDHVMAGGALSSEDLQVHYMDLNIDLGAAATSDHNPVLVVLGGN
ncbi:endonuclease/exonuclease/phosphatase family protein [Mesorhizobium sp. CC13]|uniref:endonuclease/exonuclease/phosphatase family protein n=1 Tax=Mesorhizobium sp. CC13 TaxID=3029194 RepID=UPI003266A52B